MQTAGFKFEPTEETDSRNGNCKTCFHTCTYAPCTEQLSKQQTIFLHSEEPRIK